MPKLNTYLEASSGEMDRGTVIQAARSKTETAFDGLAGAIVREPSLDSASRAILIGEAQNMMKARDDRVHIGQRRPLRVAVSIFTVSFISCLVLTAIFGSPFQIFMPNEPEASLSEVLKGL